jgi:tRNA-dihydrouridine synthase
MYTEAERPIVAQLFSSHPEKMKGAAKLAAELGFDGIDINMGCPDKSIEKQGAGAAMIKDKAAAKAVLEAAREGVRESGKPIPVSIKTRIGYNKNEIQDWIGFLLTLELPVLTVHLRTRKEMSDVPAHWELMPEVIALRDSVQSHLPVDSRTIILGNGDVTDLADGEKKVRDSGADGAMLGRAIFGNPWLFNKKITRTKSSSGISKEEMEERLRVCVEHTELFEKLFLIRAPGEKAVKNFAIMKKHYKAYVHGWDGSKELRMKLMETENAGQVRDIIDTYLKRE